MIHQFFHQSELLDHLVLRPLSHIRPNWEIQWDSRSQTYMEEDSSFAKELNCVLAEISKLDFVSEYHAYEDIVVNKIKDLEQKGFFKDGKYWQGGSYDFLLQEGGFYDLDSYNLICSAAGRYQAAKLRKQENFDSMEKGHRKMLSIILSLILYHRYS